MATVRASHTINPGALQRLMHGRTGDVGRFMASFAARSTIACRGVAAERIDSRTGRYVAGISSTTEGSPRGVKVVTSASAPQSNILERGQRPHSIEPVNARVLRFQVGGRTVFARHVDHPGARGYHILRDGVRRAGRSLG